MIIMVGKDQIPMSLMLQEKKLRAQLMALKGRGMNLQNLALYSLMKDFKHLTKIWIKFSITQTLILRVMKL